jgi:hypothetical protein
MTSTQIEHWLKLLKTAWETKDPQLAANLCPESGFEYFETPYDKPLTSKTDVMQIWQEVPEDQSDIHFDYYIIDYTDKYGFIEWRANFYSKKASRKINLFGAFLVSLNDQGLCKLFKQWWVEKK